MPKKKKKSRASLGTDETKSLAAISQAVPIIAKDSSSLRVVKSSSSLKKSLKFEPTILLNERDAESLDVLNGDEVFLFSDFESDNEDNIHSAIAKVQINYNSQLTSPMKSPSSKQQRFNKLTTGHCHIFPTSLAESFIKRRDTDSQSSISDTPKSAAPITPISKTPMSASTPSSSKSKFSFSKGGGGDLLISSPSYSQQTSTFTQHNSESRNVWIVPRESSLGQGLHSLLCQNATSIIVTENESSTTSKMNQCNGPLGKQLILAHITHSYMKRGTSFRLSFQGQFIDCRVDDVKGASTVDDVVQSLSDLTLGPSSESSSPLLQKFRSMNQHLLDKLRLFLITSQTPVVVKEENSKDDDADLRTPKLLVAGLEDTIQEVKTLLYTPLLHPELFSDNLRPPKGMLLHGPSGTGKSSVAVQLSQDLEANNIHIEHINCTLLQSQTALVGQAEQRLVELFESAQQPRPGKLACLVILDDVHLICPRREGTNLGADRLSATLLALLDGVSSSSKAYPFMILAITTNPSLLDPALRRPGRLDSEVEVPLPDEPSTRSKILKFHINSLGAKANYTNKEWLSLARIAKGFTGADLKLAVKEALRATSLKNTNSEMEIIREEMESAIRATKPSAVKAVSVEIPQVHWSSIGGMDYVKRELQEAIELPMTHGAMFQKLGIRPPRGVLLYGPPGCSKTLMARALATEGGMNFLAVKGPELLSKWLGESERALAALFRRARLASPSVIFFDEIDAIASKRSGNSSGGERLLSQLLTELDGIHSKDDAAKKRRVVIVCATNRPDLLDAALMRPGRIDRMIYVGIPDEASRYSILELTLKGKACASDIDISRLAKDDFSGGLSGAELVAACRDAALIALEEDERKGIDNGKPIIQMHNLVKAIKSMERQISQDMLDFYSSFQGITAR